MGSVRCVGKTSEKHLPVRAQNSASVAVETDMNMELDSSLTETL